MDNEYDQIVERTDGNSFLPSQDLLTEDSLNERTLVDDGLSDTDFQNFVEEQVQCLQFDALSSLDFFIDSS